MKTQNAFVSWSGGKDSCLAYYKALGMGFDVSYLLNFIDLKGRSMPHQIRSELIYAQSKALDIPLIQKKTSSKLYEKKFTETMKQLKQIGVEIGIFGDIDIQLHRDYTEKLCDGAIKPLWPLWKRERDEILNDLIRAGFVAIVVVTKANLLGKEWLGRRVDKDFIKDLKKHEGVDICGEWGEYHTFVIDGPIFKKRIKIVESDKKLRKYVVAGVKEWHWLLDISKCELCAK
jgi:uncharacterized protein (TIGR00290 family)